MTRQARLDSSDAVNAAESPDHPAAGGWRARLRCWQPLLRSLFGVLLYACAVVWTSWYPSAWTVLVVALPLLLVAGAYARGTWRQTSASLWRRLCGPVLLGGLLALLWLATPLLLANFVWVYLLQHAGVHLALGLWFGASLLASREPMCAQFARWAHPGDSLPEVVRDYTRRVTQVWTVFFLVIALSSPLVLWLGGVARWSVYSTFVTMGLTAALFMVEGLVRRRTLPPTYRTGLLATWRAIDQHFRAPTVVSASSR